MKCNSCGREIQNEVKKCPYCDAVVVEAQSQKDMVNRATMQPDIESNEAEKTVESQNSLVGKKYTFISVRGTNMAGIFNSRITSNVEVAEDRLFIDIKPKRLNKAPAILFEDITGIEIDKKINLYYWIWIVISVIGGFAAPYMFIFTCIFIFCGLQRKITISQRNGVKVIMYENSKTGAEEFKEDMKKVTKIQ